MPAARQVPVRPVIPRNAPRPSGRARRRASIQGCIRNKIIRETESDRIGSADACAGEREIRADLSRDSRKQPGCADVRNKPDGDLGHRKPRRLGDDAVARMGGEPDAAAHDDAGHEGYHRLLVAGDLRVQPVFLGPERFHSAVTRSSAIANVFDIATGTKPARARAVDQNEVQVSVLLPIVEYPDDVPDHRGRKRIDFRRPIERDDARAAVA